MTTRTSTHAAPITSRVWTKIISTAPITWAVDATTCSTSTALQAMSTKTSAEMMTTSLSATMSMRQPIVIGSRQLLLKMAHAMKSAHLSRSATVEHRDT